MLLIQRHDYIFIFCIIISCLVGNIAGWSSSHATYAPGQLSSWLSQLLQPLVGLFGRTTVHARKIEARAITPRFSPHANFEYLLPAGYRKSTCRAKVYKSPLKCPENRPGFYKRSSSCYFISSAVMPRAKSAELFTLSEARSQCAGLDDDSGQSQNAWHLFVINDAEEFRRVAPILNEMSGSAPQFLWISQTQPVRSVGDAYILGSPYIYSDSRCVNAEPATFIARASHMTPRRIREALSTATGCNMASNVRRARQNDIIASDNCQNTRLHFVCELELDAP